MGRPHVIDHISTRDWVKLTSGNPIMRVLVNDAPEVDFRLSAVTKEGKVTATGVFRGYFYFMSETNRVYRIAPEEVIRLWLM